VREAPGLWRVWGRGVGGLVEPSDVLDMGNAGTGARLLMGLLASHPFTSLLTGDASLRSRPMRRVIEPLSRIGAQFLARSDGRLPLALRGTGTPLPIRYTLPVASAQVKSAILLAGLNTPGDTVVIEPTPSRDHTELILRGFGAELSVEPSEDGGRIITLRGQPEITGRPVAVPGDPSSAAFPAVAALIVPDSEVTLRNVGINPLRFGLYETLLEMGASIEPGNPRDQAGEPAADLTLRFSRLNGVDVPASRAPSMIDEYPILAIAAACAHGTTRMFGLSELRVKESDRLTAIATGLSACGTRVEVDGDTLIVHGNGTPPTGGATVRVDLDHRIAMAFLVLGMATPETVTVDDASAIATSFPGFVSLMNDCGARITTPDGNGKGARS
ncbi:MAG: 3-phosphoshikimate 1-carboxyvinyltransferase, partial [Alphaproteobacteria bacterium]